jgi:hypothetical protein
MITHARELDPKRSLFWTKTIEASRFCFLEMAIFFPFRYFRNFPRANGAIIVFEMELGTRDAYIPFDTGVAGFERTQRTLLTDLTLDCAVPYGL